LTLVCPITTNIEKESEILRVRLKKSAANLKVESDIMIDQIRAIDNRRLLNKIGELSKDLQSNVRDNIRIILDLDL
jgi:mRNA interferase MazF